VTVRPLDAYGALAFLRSLSTVYPDYRPAGLVQRWQRYTGCHGAGRARAPGERSRAGVSGCARLLSGVRLKDHFAATRYQAYAPLRVYIGTADEEVSPQKCRALLTDAGGDVRIHFYDEATHDFDDPGPRRQQLPANAEARSDVIERARSFFAKKLGASPGSE
jgi:dienelactone hydrolase